MKKVFVTGGTGFVGRSVVNRLLQDGFEVLLLVRRRDAVVPDGVTAVFGDVLDKQSLAKAMSGADVVVHLVGIIREFPAKGITFEKLHYEASVNVVDAAKESGIKRFVHMSANGTREGAVSGYHKTKYRAEEYLKSSGLDYTIFRPSLIYGKGDEFINMLAGYMKKTPVFSYFGDGSYPMQPIHVEQVAKAFVKAIDIEEAAGNVYGLCGTEVFTYKEILGVISKALGKKTILLPVPEFVIKTAVALFSGFSFFPITKDQMIMLFEGNTCPDNSAFKLFDLEEKNLFETVSVYLS